MSGSDATTPTLGLVQPSVGGSDNTWGNKQNNNETLIDNFAGATNGTLASLQSQITSLQNQINAFVTEGVGTVKWWPSDNWSFGGGSWVLCDGSLWSIASYRACYNILGTRWGGDGVNNFAVPDLRGCVTVGMDQGTGRLAGQYGSDHWGGVGGAAIVTLSAAQVPPHQHGGGTDMQGDHQHVASNGEMFATIGAHGYQTYPFNGPSDGCPTTNVTGAHDHAIITDIQGGGQAHTNCQPGVLGYWIIRIA